MKMGRRRETHASRGTTSEVCAEDDVPTTSGSSTRLVFTVPSSQPAVVNRTSMDGDDDGGDDDDVREEILDNSTTRERCCSDAKLDLAYLPHNPELASQMAKWPAILYRNGTAIGKLVEPDIWTDDDAPPSSSSSSSSPPPPPSSLDDDTLRAMADSGLPFRIYHLTYRTWLPASKAKHKSNGAPLSILDDFAFRAGSFHASVFGKLDGRSFVIPLRFAFGGAAAAAKAALVTQRRAYVRRHQCMRREQTNTNTKMEDVDADITVACGEGLERVNLVLDTRASPSYVKAIRIQIIVGHEAGVDCATAATSSVERDVRSRRTKCTSGGGGDDDDDDDDDDEHESQDDSNTDNIIQNDADGRTSPDDDMQKQNGEPSTTPSKRVHNCANTSTTQKGSEQQQRGEAPASQDSSAPASQDTSNSAETRRAVYMRSSGRRNGSMAGSDGDGDDDPPERNGTWRRIPNDDGVPPKKQPATDQDDDDENDDDDDENDVENGDARDDDVDDDTDDGIPLGNRRTSADSLVDRSSSGDEDGEEEARIGRRSHSDDELMLDGLNGEPFTGSSGGHETDDSLVSSELRSGSEASIGDSRTGSESETISSVETDSSPTGSWCSEDAAQMFLEPGGREVPRMSPARTVMQPPIVSMRGIVSTPRASSDDAETVPAFSPRSSNDASTATTATIGFSTPSKAKSMDAGCQAKLLSDEGLDRASELNRTPGVDAETQTRNTKKTGKSGQRSFLTPLKNATDHERERSASAGEFPTSALDVFSAVSAMSADANAITVSTLHGDATDPDTTMNGLLDGKAPLASALAMATTSEPVLDAVNTSASARISTGTGTSTVDASTTAEESATTSVATTATNAATEAKTSTLEVGVRTAATATVSTATSTEDVRMTQSSTVQTASAAPPLVKDVGEQADVKTKNSRSTPKRMSMPHLEYQGPPVPVVPPALCQAPVRADFERLLTATMPSAARTDGGATLQDLWGWYKKPSFFGCRVDTLSGPRGASQAFYVPFLSAMQLFKRGAGKTENGGAGVADTANAEGATDVATPSTATNIGSTAQEVTASASADTSFLFEFFETDPPPFRPPLFERMKRLGESSGIPNLWSTRLADLHESSWICVAWYPIYRVPDGPLRTCFLTYHILGVDGVNRDANDAADDEDVSKSVPSALTAVGFKWYYPAMTGTNHEHWFASHDADVEDAAAGGLDEDSVEAYQSTEMRLSELEYNAMVLARGSLRPINEPAKRRHPDFEFFSRRNAAGR